MPAHRCKNLEAMLVNISPVTNMDLVKLIDFGNPCYGVAFAKQSVVKIPTLRDSALISALTI
jgi:hypothetical protein